MDESNEINVYDATPEQQAVAEYRRATVIRLRDKDRSEDEEKARTAWKKEYRNSYTSESFQFDEREEIIKDIAVVLNVDIDVATEYLETLERQEKDIQDKKQKRESEKSQRISGRNSYIKKLAQERFEEIPSKQTIMEFYDVDEVSASEIFIEMHRDDAEQVRVYKTLDNYIATAQDSVMLKTLSDILEIPFKQAKEYVENKILKIEEETA